MGYALKATTIVIHPTSEFDKPKPQKPKPPPSDFKERIQPKETDQGDEVKIDEEEESDFDTFRAKQMEDELRRAHKKLVHISKKEV